jgi:hypothetical protein
MLPQPFGGSNATHSIRSMDAMLFEVSDGIAQIPRAGAPMAAGLGQHIGYLFG